MCPKLAEGGRVNDSLKIAEECRKAKERGDREETKRLNGAFQRHARKDKAAFVRSECVQLENDNRSNNTKEVFATIRSLHAELRPRLGALKDHN